MAAPHAGGRSMRLPGILSAAALAIAGAGAADASIWLHFLFKPLTTILILLRVLRIPHPASPRYRRAIITGIALSLCGDVFLMLPASVTTAGFMLGLGSFLVAHLFFLRALTVDVRLFSKPLIVLLFALVGAVNLAILWPGLAAGLKVPVVAYIVCLIAMASQAVTRYLHLRTRASRLAAIGSVFFMLSDTILAYDKFHAPIYASALLILATYYTALLLIADSVATDDVTPQSTPAQDAPA